MSNEKISMDNKLPMLACWKKAVGDFSLSKKESEVNVKPELVRPMLWA